ncbi:unnamed protein product [Arctia plantaginis]|uniref:Uncharacterized protein n=1 Tax=Arctia plantaginis TaxID=874455 RepID=A0A8S1AVJ6_ARCPL|nr:unnamed protein product [Arctia plantaginis]
MKTGRSKLILKLVKETSENVQITSSTHEECFDEEDCIPGTPECQSPLPPGARNIIENMNDIYEDIFSDDGHETSKIIKLTNENMNPNIPSSVARNDPFMVVYQNASSPALLPSENQHGAVSLNISSDLTPLNTSTLVSDLSPFPQSITLAIVNNGQTPIPSPAKIHGEVFNDFPGPNPDDASYSNCPSNNTAVSSCQSSPVALIRCRGKKRVRNYGDWKEVNRKRLTNAGKEYSSKKGVVHAYN